ncbi:DUF3021 domain-containing protein [Eremococcus coleocola]|uniref:DUF3021 domain-containing protein n=1 Tax=Eremococcus coleocola ACS-139-V-Col8 TaxID=908337 RepID=E4KPZ1_9LACT|nr:DUF3021 domain-containing protein [Eremococcus coleocola]EFR31248.1 hypothetical protein HMPREF9257_1630 [Eremococcus coleocola ACS-139-V-Col8]
MTVKEVLKSSFVGLGVACLIFILVGLVFDWVNQGELVFASYAFSKMALGSLVIGLGFGLPSVVYENDRLSMGMQSLIHMGTGCLVMVGVFIWEGWLPQGHGLLMGLAVLAGAVLIAGLIWYGFYKENLKQAQALNKGIQAKRMAK